MMSPEWNTALDVFPWLLEASASEPEVWIPI
jgi:hypothetical protein